jgi:flagellar motor switch protein FliG
MKNTFTDRLLIAAIAAVALLSAPQAWAGRPGNVDSTKRTAEDQIRRLIEPLLDKYCPDQCKLLSVNATVEVATPDTVAPGFDDVERSPASDTELTPSGARIKLLMDDKVGPVSRGKLIELVQQYLETLDYPVKVDTQLAHFPAPVGSESRVAELRQKIVKQFRGTMDELFNQFCPEQCLLADFDVQIEAVNAEEAQYGKPGEFVQDGGIAVRIKDISGTVLMDDLLTPEEQKNVLEMAKLKTNQFKNVTLTARSMHFPHADYMSTGRGNGNGLANGRGGDAGTDSEKSVNRSLASDTKETRNASTNSTQSSSSTQSSQNSSANSSKSSNSSTENNKKEERFEHYEKIERVENGDAVQAELKKFGMYGLVFACAVLSLLIFVAMAALRPRGPGAGNDSPITRIIQSMSSDPAGAGSPGPSTGITADDHRGVVALRYEIDRLLEELTAVFAQHPKVAKQVFSRVLTEEGVETTAQYIHLFGESIVLDMLRDPSLQSDLSELMEFYAKNPIELKDDEKLELLKKLHNRTVAGKLVVMGNRSSNLFDYLGDMDGMQILELIRTESLTVKSIVLTQVDPQRRQAIYTQLDEDTRMKLLTELSRIDYLPRDYIFNVANALKRKRRDNPRLNTEALPGSEVLVNLLERTGVAIQRSVVKNLEITAPDSARVVKSKLVSMDTLRFLRDGQLLEVVLSLRHDELLMFLKGAPAEIRAAVFAKSPKELVVELEDELATLGSLTREAYTGIERKVLNRMKMMANEGLINLVETNERMFSEASVEGLNAGFVSAEQNAQTQTSSTTASIKKVGGW